MLTKISDTNQQIYNKFRENKSPSREEFNLSAIIKVLLL
jgi:hypothetical protein